MLPACTEKAEWRRRRRRNQIETHLAYLHLQRTEYFVSEETFYHPKDIPVHINNKVSFETLAFWRCSILDASY
jgi:hypothetical protein